MRLVDLLLPFTGTDQKSVPYKAPTVLHEFPYMWTKWFAYLDIEFRYYVAPSNGFFGPRIFLLFAVVVIDPEGYV